MNGPQHLAAANLALEKAHGFTGPRDDIDQFNRHMRLFEAHLSAAQFALDVAKSAAAELADDTSYVNGKRERAEALFQNRAAWIAAVTDGGVK